MKKTDSENSIEDCEEALLRRLQDPTVPPIGGYILRALQKSTRQTISDLDQLYGFRDVPRRTIKYHLRKLVASGHVQKRGRGKGTWYTL